MKNKTFDTELLKKKNQTIDNAIKILKEEFVGIDKQIDEIMYNADMVLISSVAGKTIGSVCMGYVR